MSGSPSPPPSDKGAEAPPASGKQRKREAPLSKEPEMESDLHLMQLICKRR